MSDAEEFVSPDILILGDSQIPFGSGPAFLEFFTHITEHCGLDETQQRTLAGLDDTSVGIIGVRSSSLHSWTARKGKAKGKVCDVDPTWNVNAGSYGVINNTNKKFVQIGQGRQYQFCEKELSPFEVMFRQNYYQPNLLLLSFMGNSAKRWAESKDDAVTDVLATMAQIPPEMPCVFMTTAPPYTEKNVKLRLQAQENLRQSFEQAGSRCSFVPGATPETVAANQGNKNYFRLNDNGGVKDPFHPNQASAKNFFRLEKANICSAVIEQLDNASVLP